MLWAGSHREMFLEGGARPGAPLEHARVKNLAFICFHEVDIIIFLIAFISRALPHLARLHPLSLLSYSYTIRIERWFSNKSLQYSCGGGWRRRAVPASFQRRWSSP